MLSAAQCITSTPHLPGFSRRPPAPGAAGESVSSRRSLAADGSLIGSPGAGGARPERPIEPRAAGVRRIRPQAADAPSGHEPSARPSGQNWRSPSMEAAMAEPHVVTASIARPAALAAEVELTADYPQAATAAHCAPEPGRNALPVRSSRRSGRDRAGGLATEGGLGRARRDQPHLPRHPAAGGRAVCNLDVAVALMTPRGMDTGNAPARQAAGQARRLLHAWSAGSRNHARP